MNTLTWAMAIVAIACIIGAILPFRKDSKRWGSLFSVGAIVLAGSGVAVAIENASIDASVAAASETSATTVSVETDGEVGTEIDGKIVIMPQIGDNDEQLTEADSTTYAPATFQGIQEQCGHGKVLSWTQLVNCIDGNEVYINAVNDREYATGFDWNDVLEFSKLEKEYAESVGADVSQLRTVQIVSFGNFPEKDARAQAQDLLGAAGDGIGLTDKTVGFSNTWALEDGVISEYYHSSQQVRVSLFPIKKVDGKIVVDDSRNEGIFVDCLNVWWQPDQTWKCTDEQCTKPAEEKEITTPTPTPTTSTPGTPGTPTTTPGTPGTPTTTPGTPGTPTTTPGTPTTPTTLKEKEASLDPASNGNANTGGGKNSNSGAGTYVPSDEMTQPSATYTAPAAPTTVPTRKPSSGQTLVPDSDPAPSAEAEVPTETITACRPDPSGEGCD